MSLFSSLLISVDAARPVAFFSPFIVTFFLSLLISSLSPNYCRFFGLPPFSKPLAIPAHPSPFFTVSIALDLLHFSFDHITYQVSAFVPALFFLGLFQLSSALRWRCGLSPFLDSFTPPLLTEGVFPPSRIVNSTRFFFVLPSTFALGICFSFFFFSPNPFGFPPRRHRPFSCEWFYPSFFPLSHGQGVRIGNPGSPFWFIFLGCVPFLYDVSPTYTSFPLPFAYNRLLVVFSNLPLCGLPSYSVVFFPVSHISFHL